MIHRSDAERIRPFFVSEEGGISLETREPGSRSLPIRVLWR